MSEYMNILKEEVNSVEAALRKFLDSKITSASKLSAWHKQYYENIKEYMTRGGKRLRPILVVVGYKAIKDEVEIDHVYQAACSVEILHNGSLLHDDLIDHDETRRGGKTFHATYRDVATKKGESKEVAFDYGMTMAILGGDSLINLGAEAITAAKLDPDIGMQCQHYYQFAYSHLVDGVLLEMNMIIDDSATSEMYLQMVRMKTAVLFDRSLMMGAAMARASESQLEALMEFGIKVGQAFQIQDDILGSFGDEEKTGKSTSGDIREGKKTMLVFETYARANKDQRKKFDDLLGKEGMTDEEVDRVREIFQDTGALRACQELMEHLLITGQAALDNAKPALNPKYKKFLIEMSNFLVQRDY
ncbi:MAG: polyprenyl synthetase family protein [Candidatus Thorarchaeota archaeon]